MRIGHGYDAHRFTKDKKMILGGVEIDYEFGFLAHSDGDVLCHAIMDSLLGAAGLGDSTVIAQQPKLKPYIMQMRETIAKFAGVSVEFCNVKATTEEKMGFTGNLEGVAAHAVCLLK